MIRQSVRDGTLVTIALLLSVFGISMVYSAGVTDGRSVAAGLWKTQAVWFCLGLFAAYVVSRLSVRMLEWLSFPAYVFSLILLALLFVLGGGAGTASSTKSWLVVGGMRLGQPSEFAKIAVVLMLARVLASRREMPRSLLELWKPLLVVGVPWLLIMAQPDLGTGIVFIGIFFAMLFWAGVPWQLLVLLASPAVSLILSFSSAMWGGWFLLLLALLFLYKPYLIEGVVLVVANVAMGVVAPILWDSLAPYQQNRLLVFLD
ncbi:MAG TPA: FtsW/RodA/SpoVE family cell cycle protein, partial [Gemmatimonadaceae bacterium]|nr:FtsW/RodA/SpoVE family cell cycle protein [Gemmatimonadaceae bacterium]